jgi:hypothetical protein
MDNNCRDGEYHDRMVEALGGLVDTLDRLFNLRSWDPRMSDYYRLESHFLKQNRISNEEKDKYVRLD